MNHPKSSLLSTILVVLLCMGLAQAQQNKSGEGNVQADDAALREKAFDALESLASQIGTLQSAENRARLGSNIAASLWKHDEKRARSVLVSVEADINAGLLKDDEDERIGAQTRMVFLKLRMDTVERIAKLDAEAALAFLKATELDPDSPRSYEVAEMERALEVRLAKQIAADHPEIALKLGRQSLARDFSDELLSILVRLQKKHPEQAVVLYKEMVSKLREVRLTPNSPASYFAMNLARSFKPPRADESTYRELISLFISTALENGCGDKADLQDERSYLCTQIGALLPEMEKVDPSRAAQLKHRAPETWSWSPDGYRELSDLMEGGTVDEVLALAQEYPHMAPQIYWQAIEMAEASGDIERARKIVTDYIDDPEARRRVIARLDRAQERDAITVERLAEAQRVLSTIPQIQTRVYFLLSLANRIGANDRKAALRLLNQAGEMLDTMKPGQEQTEAEMALAMMYCLEKHGRGLDMMQSLLSKLNDLVGAAIKLDGYESNYLREGEWNMSMNGNIGRLLTQLSQNAAYFAWCDFDRSISMATQFERPELRLMAQLKLAQAILAGPPKRIIRGPDY